ncbi:MAG: hypothetical protein HFJ55_01560 [Clostridia bacterium]|nr:hypothetical protein [Clostridia bacterium]
MIIVSQNRRDIINYDFTQRIGLDRESNFTSINAYQNGNASAECMVLGVYETKERAKEVLQEIVGKYKQYNLDNNKALPKVYEMPRE